MAQKESSKMFENFLARLDLEARLSRLHGRWCHTWHRVTEGVKHYTPGLQSAVQRQAAEAKERLDRQARAAAEANVAAREAEAEDLARRAGLIEEARANHNQRNMGKAAALRQPGMTVRGITPPKARRHTGRSQYPPLTLWTGGAYLAFPIAMLALVNALNLDTGFFQFFAVVAGLALAWLFRISQLNP